MRSKLRRTLLIACMSLALAPLGNAQAGLILQDVGLSWGNFAVPTQTAVVRSRVKRFVRENFRRHQSLLSALDLVVLANLLANPLGDRPVVNGGELRWGTPHPSTPFRGLGGKSAIQASSRAPINPVELDSSTEIVDLLYINANLFPPQLITSADLTLLLAFDQGSAQATYRITINETPDPKVGDPSGRAADSVSARELESIDFLDDFNITFQDMLVLRALEGDTAEGAISIMVTAVPQILPPEGVPEPSVLWMMATGLLVLLGTPGLLHRSKRRAVSDRNP